jgi:hypothetical protein
MKTWTPFVLGLVLVGACKFSAHPPSGVQSCSDDDPPQCPDGYACINGLCYDNAQLPGTGGAQGGDVPPADDAGEVESGCTPVEIHCGTGPGKRCGKVPDLCDGTVECGACISGEGCQTGHVCVPTCGQLGLPCCVGSTCTAAETACSNGNCVACGGASQVCCAGDTCSALGTTCADTPTTDTGKACLLACAVSAGACATGTDVDCTLVCGPGKLGSKTCTCTADSWKCPLCSFPADKDYTCYRLPATMSACDPSTLVTDGADCTAPACSPCGSSTSKSFIDVTGTTRLGYCVCADNRWSCTMVRDWPCPGNPGC